MEIKIIITGRDEPEEYTVVSDSPISFRQAMAQLGLNLYTPCGGAGRCLKCGIRFVYGASEITKDDDRAFDCNRLRDGYRLGCKALLKKDCKIEVPHNLLADILLASTQLVEKPSDLAIACDVGSTTIAMAVVDLNDGKVVAERTAINSQINYGADVMTRIKAASQGKDKEMFSLIRRDLAALGMELVGNMDYPHKVICAGNTTMVHLAMDYPCGGLSHFPFVPYTLEAVDFVEKYRQIHIFPGIGAFVGGDIVSGLYYLDLPRINGVSVLVDMGTNAEIVLFDGRKYYCASAAAGPALEGGKISCGIASIEGAISHVNITDVGCCYETIGNKPACGICGSGIIDAIYELHKAGIIDDGGLLEEKYMDEGYPVADNIFITAEDIQQVLLAKSAICSGIEVLVSEAGLSIEDIDHLYVAGGLGAAARPEAVAGIGIIPQGLLSKYEAVGNTSLLGTIKYACSSDDAKIDAIISASQVVELGGNALFDRLFIENLFL